MAQNSVTDNLALIASAPVHEVYGEQTKTDVHNLQEYAKLILALNPAKSLPYSVRPQYGPQHFNVEMIGSWTFAEWNGFAIVVTEAMCGSMGQLKAIPPNQQHSQNVITSFGKQASLFVLCWNYLLPTMQALAGPQNANRAAEDLAELKKANEDAQTILKGMRDASGQVGLSRESVHFKAAVEDYERRAFRWLVATVALTCVFFASAVFTLFAFRWDPISPKNSPESVQFVSGKVLVFVALSYAILLCARSYFANRHNAVVNRHRQDALLTYQALVEAAKDTANREVVLQDAY